jgi:phenylacetate-CoA ligase
VGISELPFKAEVEVFLMRTIYLESWIHARVSSEMGSSIGSPYRSNIGIYHLKKLRRMLQYCYEKSSFYRGLFEQYGFQYSSVGSLQDLPRIPFTDPGQLAAHPYRFLCVSQAEVARPYSFVTSGTTGPRKKVFWTRDDIERITDFMAAGIMTVAGKGDVVQIFLPDGRLFSQADLLRRGVLKAGATAVIAGTESSAEAHLRMIDRHRSSILFGYAGPLCRMTRQLQSEHDLSARGVRVLFLAGDVPDATREELEKIWNCRVYTHYGLTEMGLGVAVECDAHDGYHFNEADLLLEIVDPVTGEPASPGSEGEVVFTTLTRQAMPLIRYRTHDLSRILPELCPCGAASLLRIDRVRKRLESVVRLSSGKEIYPSLFDDLLSGIPEVLDYRIVVTRHGSTDCLEIGVEAVELRNELLTSIQSRLNSLAQSAEIDVKLLPRGTLESSGRIKKMILDRRTANSE